MVYVDVGDWVFLTHVLWSLSMAEADWACRQGFFFGLEDQLLAVYCAVLTSVVGRKQWIPHIGG